MESVYLVRERKIRGQRHFPLMCFLSLIKLETEVLWALLFKQSIAIC